MSSWPAVSLQPSRVALGPGDDATIDVGITNTGDVVEHYGVQILGLPPGQLADVEPPVTKLQPGESGQVSVRLELSEQVPPDAATLVLGVLVRSPYRPQEVSRAEELRLEVLPAPGLSAQAEPEVAQGARGDYRVTLRNSGNTGLDVVLRGSDPEGAVRLSFSPQRVALAPGASAIARVGAAASRPLTGREVQRRIAVVAQAGAQSSAVDLTLVQRPRIAGGLMRVGAAAGGLLVAVGTMFGATLLVTHAIAGAGKNQNTQNVADQTGQPGAAGQAGANQATATTAGPSPSVTTPGASASVVPSAGPSTQPSGPPAGQPIDVDLTKGPADGRTGWRVINSDAFPGLLLSSRASPNASPECVSETRVQYATAGTVAVVTPGAYSGTAGHEIGTCMDQPLLIRFQQPVTTVTLTVLARLVAEGPGATATYGIVAGAAPTPRTVSGAVFQPLQLTWSDPAGFSQVTVGGYPGYKGTITALQRITAS